MSKVLLIKPGEQVLPPNSVEAEQGLIGSILLDPKHCMEKVLSQLVGGVESFYDQRHQIIYKEILNSPDAIDEILIYSKLKDSGQLEAAGGMAYISSLQNATPSAANVSHYIAIVLEKWRLRRLKVLATAISDMVILGESASQIQAIASKESDEVFKSAAPDRKGIKELARDVVDNLNDVFSGKEPIGVEVGIRSIDRMIRGINREFVVVAARPSMGKTATLLSFARNIAKQHISKKGAVGFISIESTAQELTKRLIGSESGLSLLRVKEFVEQDFRALMLATAVVGKLPIDFRFERGMTVDQFCAIAISMSRSGDLQVIFGDWLGKLKGSKEHWNDRDRICEVTERLSMLKEHLKIPIIMAHQIDRSADDGRKPRLRDLSGSSSIEQDADIVMFVHQNNSENGRQRGDTVDASIIVEKRRDGETGECPVQFRRYCGVVEDLPLDPQSAT